MKEQKGIRINKFLSEAGFCSRREADKLIDKNRVKINGKVPLIGTKVMPGDRVTVDNKVINVGGYKISKYSLLLIISKIFKKNVYIKKYPHFKIDRSLDSKNFRKISKYKKKSWEKMIKNLRIFMLKNKYKF